MAFKDDFVSRENRRYSFKLGRLVASSLTGFLFGAVVASIVWYVVLNFFYRGI